MSQDTRRLTITLPDDLDEQVDDINDAAGHDHQTETGRELLRRGIEDWRQDHQEYPGQEQVTDAIRISTLATLVAGLVTIGTRDALAYESTMMLVMPMLAFVALHYILILYADLHENL